MTVRPPLLSRRRLPADDRGPPSSPNPASPPLAPAGPRSRGLTDFGLSLPFKTSTHRIRRPRIQGGIPRRPPYAAVASVPRKQLGPEGEASGGCAASADFSKLILAVEDRNLVEPSTTTTSGLDLYEYTGGELRQVNVGIGTCGARIVHGFGRGRMSSCEQSHSLSADGSRVFFESVPGSNCSERSHLYMRVGGAETVDLGPARLLAANETGTEVLLEKAERRRLRSPPIRNRIRHLRPPIHDAQRSSQYRRTARCRWSKAHGALFCVQRAAHPGSPARPKPCKRRNDGSLPIRHSRGPASLFQATPTSADGLIQAVSPDGRYAYFEPLAIAGLPAASPAATVNQRMQVYRYDSAGSVVQCVSCASPFDPEPRMGAFLLTTGTEAPSSNRPAPLHGDQR